jgi:hypothetical protein
MKLTKEQQTKAHDLCRRLPLIEGELRAAGLFATAVVFNQAVKSIGYEFAELLANGASTEKGGAKG